VAAADTAVLYMAAGEASAVKTALLHSGVRASIPVAIAESVSLDARVHAGILDELPSLAARLGAGPALVLLGDVFAALRAAQRYLPSTSGNVMSSAGDAAGRRKASQSA
jgi:siroheme synthase